MAELKFNLGGNRTLTGKLIPYIAGIANSENYYTKTETDEKFATKEDVNGIVVIKEWTKEDIEGSGE